MMSKISNSSLTKFLTVAEQEDFKPHTLGVNSIPDEQPSQDEPFQDNMIVWTHYPCLLWSDLFASFSLKMYSPHKFARQFGLDQSVPCLVVFLEPMKMIANIA
ncbi:hypothetical protein L1049_012624 [Liquidambar formosana]|uniref:Uncharacterized protein n=1 Tax=Liquidambar formosana TaxID=63359 RepID=A0AAP0N7B6_LIQFO